jgi:hypothetical protein
MPNVPNVLRLSVKFSTFILTFVMLGVILLHPRGRFVEQKLMLSSNFRCDEIHKHCHEF